MFRTILVPIDIGHDGVWERALEAAFAVSRIDGGRMHILHVVRPTPPIAAPYLPRDFVEAATAASLEVLKSKVSELGITPDEAQFAVRHGEPCPEILRFAEEIGADLMVVGAHRPDTGAFLIGSTAERLVRHARCSVFVVRQIDG